MLNEIHSNKLTVARNEWEKKGHIVLGKRGLLQLSVRRDSRHGNNFSMCIRKGHKA